MHNVFSQSTITLTLKNNKYGNSLLKLLFSSQPRQKTDKGIRAGVPLHHGKLQPKPQSACELHILFQFSWIFPFNQLTFVLCDWTQQSYTMYVIMCDRMYVRYIEWVQPGLPDWDKYSHQHCCLQHISTICWIIIVCLFFLQNANNEWNSPIWQHWVSTVCCAPYTRVM